MVNPSHIVAFTLALALAGAFVAVGGLASLQAVSHMPRDGCTALCPLSASAYNRLSRRLVCCHAPAAACRASVACPMQATPPEVDSQFKPYRFAWFVGVLGEAAAASEALLPGFAASTEFRCFAG